MPENPYSSRISLLRAYVTTGIKNIASWNDQVPQLQGTASYLDWIDESLQNIPPGTNAIVNEQLIDYLDVAAASLGVLGQIPEPPKYIQPVILTTARTLWDVYSGYVTNVADHNPDNPGVSTWAAETKSTGQRLTNVEARSASVQKRLVQLDPETAELHRKAIDAALTAEATQQKIVEAAALLDRVLEKFFGRLWAISQGRRKATYRALSESLAANSPLTKAVVADGQATLERLNGELMRIRKSMTPVEGARVVSLLRQVEGHILVITDALDPEKVGIVFAG